MMIKKWIFILVATAGLVSGCSHTVAPMKAEPVNIYSDYDQKVPGKWIVIIDPSVEFIREVKPSTYVCSAHSYPLNSGATIRESLKTMFDRIMEEPTYRNGQPTGEEIAESGARGVAIVRLDSFTPRLACQTGFWSGTCTATIELSFGFEAKDPNGQLMGTAVGAEKTYDGDSGAMCGDASNILAEAYRLALKESLERLAERIGNARRLRNDTTS